jgi:hypothetical protein
MRLAAGSMGAVSKKRRVLERQWSHTAKAAWRWQTSTTGLAVESGIDGAEAQDRSFGTAGSGPYTSGRPWLRPGYMSFHNCCADGLR